MAEPAFICGPYSKRAWELMQWAHQGEVDKFGDPFVWHPIRVAHYAAQLWDRGGERIAMLESLGWTRDKAVAAALAHDTVERASIAMRSTVREVVRADLGDLIADAVEAWSYLPDEDNPPGTHPTVRVSTQAEKATANLLVLTFKPCDLRANVETHRLYPRLGQTETEIAVWKYIFMSERMQILPLDYSGWFDLPPSVLTLPLVNAYVTGARTLWLPPEGAVPVQLNVAEIAGLTVEHSTPAASWQ